MDLNMVDGNVITYDKSVLVRDKKTQMKIYTSKSIKRTIDITASIFGIILLVPIFFIVITLNKIYKIKGGLFFIQERIGQDGKNFKMYKFQTMVPNAEEILEDILQTDPVMREEYRVNKKFKNDPRLTKVGKFLRKTSLDEFPQFINILKGDMSLVGPRPYLPREKVDMMEYYGCIIENKPGLTGLWQISGRSDVSFAERLRLDVEYHKSKSNIKDISIVMQTAFSILGKKGAI